jgi:hypothetical protein
LMEWRMGALREQKTCGRSGGKRYRQGQLTRKAATNTDQLHQPTTFLTAGLKSVLWGENIELTGSMQNSLEIDVCSYGTLGHGP